jgi:hypothetical protein
MNFYDSKLCDVEANSSARVREIKFSILITVSESSSKNTDLSLKFHYVDMEKVQGDDER